MQGEETLNADSIPLLNWRLGIRKWCEKTAVCTNPCICSVDDGRDGSIIQDGVGFQITENFNSKLLGL